MKSRVVAMCGCILLAAGRSTALVAQAQQDGSLQQEGFTPIDQLPPQDQLPAAPLLIGAYVFVIVVLFVYLFSLATRLKSVQRQVERLEDDAARRKA